MLVRAKVSLHRLILSLCQTIDHADPSIAYHQQQVAYISTVTARHLGFKGEDLQEVFLAAALHDIALIGVEDRGSAAELDQLELAPGHAEAGFQLVKDNQLLSGTADLIRYHHVEWAHGKGVEQDGHPIPFGAHILALSDAVGREITRGTPVLQQAEPITEKIISLSEKVFHPDCVDAFRDVAQTEAFWLGAANRRVCSVLLKQMDCQALTIDEIGLASIAEAFGRVVDASSPWTAVHSAGVAASAVAIAKRFAFSPRELHMMRAAGYLHDLGKLAVPKPILNKPGRLTKSEMATIKEHPYHTFSALSSIGGIDQISEWAAFHHERLDGSGYPFHLTEQDLLLGSRIMAVADMFTAMMEARPYRAAMSSIEALAVLKEFVRTRALDRNVMSTLEHDYEAIDAERRNKQVEYGEKQQRLLGLMGKLSVAWAE